MNGNVRKYGKLKHKYSIYMCHSLFVYFICVVLCKRAEDLCHIFYVLWSQSFYTLSSLSPPPIFHLLLLHTAPPPPSHFPPPPTPQQYPSFISTFSSVVSLALIYLGSRLKPLFDVAFSFAGGRQRRGKGAGVESRGRLWWWGESLEDRREKRTNIRGEGKRESGGATGLSVFVELSYSD